MLSEKGLLRETPPVKLLLNVFDQNHTGILYLKGKEALKVLYFNKGSLVWAISNSENDKLENILIRKGTVDAGVLKEVASSLQPKESIGKKLVEKGLLSLEDLIDSTRIQLRGIVSSVLRWNDGTFQFVKDAPPERLLSLELDVVDFILEYIIRDLDMSEIWKSFGTLNVVFKKSDDDKRISRYRLNAKQKEILSAFDGKRNLEEVLAVYSGSHRDSLLKLFYYFSQTEMIQAVEPDEEGAAADFTEETGFKSPEEEIFINEPSHSDLDQSVETSFDKIMSEESNASEYESSDHINIEPVKPASEEDSSYVINSEPDIEKPVFTDNEETEFRESETLKNEASETDFDVNSLIESEGGGDKKNYNKIILLLIVVLILGSLIIGFLLREKKSLPFSGSHKQSTEKKSSVSAKKSIKKEIKQVPVKKDKAQVLEIKKSKASENKVIPKKSKVQDKSTKKQVKDSKKEVKINPGSVSRYFRKGDFHKAASLWKSEFKSGAYTHSILLELDCMKESVTKAYSYLSTVQKKHFFILPLRRGGRTCWLVMYGRYSSIEEAEAKVSSLPSYFRTQSPPAKGVDLDVYVKD